MGISIWQIVLVLVIIVILFGAGKIPRVMGDIAKGIKSFKAGMKEGEEAAVGLADYRGGGGRGCVRGRWCVRVGQAA